MTPAELDPVAPLALVVDDDPSMRLMLERTLAKAGVRVACAGDAAAALDACARAAPDIVLLDIGLPDRDGFDACRALRALPGRRDLPVMMLTGRDDAESVRRAYEAGATDFVAKPINWELLAHRVQFVLRSARAFAEVAKSRASLAHAQRIARLGSWDWDFARAELRWSEEAARVLGLGDDEHAMRLDAFLARLESPAREPMRLRFAEALQHGGALAAEERVRRPDGAERVVQLCGEVGLDAAGAVERLSGTIQDVTEQRAAEARIRFLAYHDSLTGLPNRAWLKDEIERAITRARRHGRSLAVLFLDLDQFKRINDTLGHSVGDQLLCAVAGRLRQRLRADDAIGRVAPQEIALSRLGGDEFCIVLGDLEHPEGAARCAARVLEGFVEPFALGEHEAVVTPSIGIALFPHDAPDAESLLKAADTAMYHTKNEGRNHYSFYSHSMNARAFERLTLEAALRRAFERDELVVHYQPIVSLGNGAIVGLEALLRWQHPERGLLMPAHFIRIAEESGLIVPIGERVLETACAQARAWQRAGLPPVAVAVNLSGEHFRRASLPSTVARVLAATGLDAPRLKLEVTESVLMRDLDVTLGNLQRVRELGARISVDDFGTGYSSLAYLKRFPIDELKIDRSFVRDVAVDARDATIASAVVRMAQALELAVVAEGVENEAQVGALQRLGCPHAQGYFFSRPQPPEAIAAMLADAIVPLGDARSPSRFGTLPATTMQ